MEPDFVWQFLSGVLQGLWEVKWALAAVALLWLMALAVRLLPRRYRKPKGPGANVIAQADWREFERLTAIALRQEGYAVRENPADLARADGGLPGRAEARQAVFGPTQAFALGRQRKGGAGTLRRNPSPVRSVDQEMVLRSAKRGARSG